MCLSSQRLEEGRATGARLSKDKQHFSWHHRSLDALQDIDSSFWRAPNLVQTALKVGCQEAGNRLLVVGALREAVHMDIVESNAGRVGMAARSCERLGAVRSRHSNALGIELLQLLFDALRALLFRGLCHCHQRSAQLLALEGWQVEEMAVEIGASRTRKAPPRLKSAQGKGGRSERAPRHRAVTALPCLRRQEPRVSRVLSSLSSALRHCLCSVAQWGGSH